MLRILLVAGAVLSLGGLVADPYTLYAHTYSPYDPAPLWRLGLSVAEGGLLLWFGVQVWKRNYRRAGLILCAATLLNILANAFFVHQEGLDRFLVMFRTDEILSIYLMLLGLRIAMLTIVVVLLTDRARQDLLPPLSDSSGARHA
jgi:hypothetical protein